MKPVIAILVILCIHYSENKAVIIEDQSSQQDMPVDSARHYNNLGIERYRAGDFEKAGSLFKVSLEIKKQESGPLSIDMATTYSNLGAVSRRLNRSDEAMKYYDTAGYIFIDHYGPDHSLLGAVYQNQGNLLREQRDINSAISYYNNALRIFQKNESTGWIATLYNNIGIAHWMLGDYEEAKEYYFLSMDLWEKIDPFGVARTAGNLALCYRETGEIELADKHYRLTIDAISESRGDDHPDLPTHIMNYGIFLITDAGEPDKGYEMLLRAYEIYRSIYGDKGNHIARTLMNIGYYFEVTGNFNAALQYYQESIVANSESFNSNEIDDNPGEEDHVFSLDYMLASLKHKAFALLYLAGESGERANLEASLAAYRSAMSYIEKIRIGQHTDDSRMLLSENEHDTYMHAIHVAWRLYRLTGENMFLDEALVFSEKSKAASLLASIRNVEARSFGGVPEELLEQERDIKRRIAAYRELIYEEQKNAAPDSEKISLWQERIFFMEQELRNLIGLLEEDYPDYHSLKYNREVSGVSSIMDRIGNRDALVSYVFNDSVVYIFAITKNSPDFHCVRTGGLTENKLEMLLDVLTSGNLDRRVNEDFNAFKESAHYFYKLLIHPVVPVITNKRLIIVPDGLLAYVPFEMLLSDDGETETGNYKELPYLIRDFTISYNYSATLWQESLSKKTAAPERLLAMAPSYEYSELPAAADLNSRQYYRDKLTSLPGARDEAVMISDIMDGNVLLDDMATENNFKQLAEDFHLLHLAMHTLMDDENPMYSKLVFTEQDDDEEDGFLNTYEIYNLKLNAGLAVLSSCRSGYGTINRGEGVMSLARGFMYAGVPSIVMTNWEIEDKSGAGIMINFYQYLLRGYRKDEALRLARLDFLDETDMLRSHPYFWGAYVCIGNPEEIFNSARQFYPVATFVFMLLAMILILWWVFFRRSQG
ncbi:MAG: CHAT domain-containing tetratricopeptide repeat protein [Bacteroidales bacterium]